MRILGLDPGTATTGYGLVDTLDGDLSVVEYGVIETVAHEDPGRRLQTIYRQLQALIDTYQPQAAAIEQIFFGRNITTAISVGQARGVLLLALTNAGIPIAEYSPLQVKDAITGYGKASKNQIQLMVQNLLGLDDIPRPDDAADGLAIAITHANYYRYQLLVAGG